MSPSTPAASAPSPEPTSTSGPSFDPPTMGGLIPLPVSVKPAGGAFLLEADATIYVDAGNAELAQIGEYLAAGFRPATGFELRVVPATGAPPPRSLILTTSDGDAELGEEGYQLTITSDFVTLSAPHPAGVFRGVQTLRQLLPPSIEAASAQAGPWPIATGVIRDRPRFAWRGAMLDVARHFFGLEEVKRFIDLLAYYKLNRLHLHLSDDQGWRIAINSWPNLATHGGSTAVGGDPGGYFSQDDYAEIVAYAQSRYITVVPEIDMPGHTHAALASYPELNCDGEARPLYTGIEVGFSSLCVGKDITYRFIEDVLSELAARTPGAYLHIGGDETQATTPEDYRRFIERVQAIVSAQGKRMVGWEEIAQADLDSTSIAQHWSSDMAVRAVEQGLQVILSPATRAYLDMQYDPSSPLGLHWARYVEVRDAYEWEPASLLEGIREDDILGVEAPLWSETLRTIQDVEFMAFPRLAGIAEIGWSTRTGRGWGEYRARLATHGPRLAAMEVNFYRSPQVDWR
ncbi:MAG TPA: beta-N-acetylhexosaminidase [Anaerolineales bacterium]|nr:beta-N-acetylhexosaminidase [Anaerolineales bacterium]